MGGFPARRFRQAPCKFDNTGKVGSQEFTLLPAQVQGCKFFKGSQPAVVHGIPFEDLVHSQLCTIKLQGEIKAASSRLKPFVVLLQVTKEIYHGKNNGCRWHLFK